RDRARVRPQRQRSPRFGQELELGRRGARRGRIDHRGRIPICLPLGLERERGLGGDQHQRRADPHPRRPVRIQSASVAAERGRHRLLPARPLPDLEKIGGRQTSTMNTHLIVWLVLCLIWGSTWLFIKIGLRDLPPFTFAGLRFLLAAAVLWAIVIAWR